MFLALKSLVWILPVLILIGGAFFFARNRRKETLTQLQGLKTNASPLRRHILTGAILSSLVLAGVALLRPSGGNIISEYRKPAKNLVFLMDVSKSMNAFDSEGLKRIEAAKLYARRIIENRPTDRIALLSFSGITFPECPTTLDHSILLKRVSALDPNSLPVGGTNFTIALKEANQLLTEEPPPGSAIIILSDGDNVANDPSETAKILADKNISVFTIGFGNEKVEANIPNSPLASAADYNTLKKLSSITGGTFFPGNPSSLDQTSSELNQLIDTIKMDGDNIAANLYNRPLELYAYPLAAALILLTLHILLPLRTKAWHPLTAAIALALVISPEASAQETDDSQSQYELFSGYTSAREQATEEELPLVLHFIGSDWSERSVTFQREILSHPVYQKWERAQAVTRIIDLKRSGISEERRTAYRALAKKFAITSYPTSLFLDAKSETTLGRLQHDPAGPASWVRRAKAIISGDEAASDSVTSVKKLPEHMRKDLEDKSLTSDERSARLYNKAIEMERAKPELTFASKDRFKLLLDFYDRAANEASSARPDLQFLALHKRAILLHTKGRKLIPDWEKGELSKAEVQAMQQAAGRSGVQGLVKKAISYYKKALSTYREAIPFHPDHPELPVNLASAYRDLERARNYLKYLKAFDSAVTHTSNALISETRLRRSLDYGVTTGLTVNNESIEKSIESITELILTSEAIQEKPTLLDPEKLPEFRFALEDIVLAPSPHGIRDLHPSTEHIKNALEHLVDLSSGTGRGNGIPMEGDPSEGGEGGEGEESGEGDGDGEDESDGDKEPGEKGPGDLKEQDEPGDKEEDGPGDKEEEKEGAGEEQDREADLRRSEQGEGDLRERLIEQLGRRMGRKGKRVHPSQDK